MGMNAVKFKIMPNSPDVDLDKLTQEANAKISELGGNPDGSEQQPIAFGLKALILSFAYPEEKEIDELENEIAKIDGITSVELEDYRKAIG